MKTSNRPCHSQTNFMALLRSFFLLAIFAFATTQSFARVAQSGYFRGTDFEPFGSARFSLLSDEPALVLIFATDAKTADITKQFDKWYQGNSRPAINIFGIAVAPADISPEVSHEAVDQRSLNYPVFLARTDLLLGENFKLVLINKGEVVQSFQTLDFPAIEKASRQLTTTAQSSTANADSPMPGVVTPTPSPRTVIEPSRAAVPSPSPSIAPPVATVSIHVSDTTAPTPLGGVAETVTTAVIAASTEPALKTGTYENTRYRMSAEFPPEWTYQEARNGDGAVGNPPPRAHLNLRVWAIALNSSKDPFDYISESLDSLGLKYDSHVSVERKFVVKDDELQGADETYNYSRPPRDSHPGAPPVLWLGRMQVFVVDSTVKAASAEAPASEFSAAQPLINSFFESFDPMNTPEDTSEPAPEMIPGT
jgi:hypothetical protein